MTNTDQKARELLAAEFDNDLLPTIAAIIRSGGSPYVLSQENLARCLRAIENTLSRPTPTPERDEVERVAREALFGVEMARTDVVNPVNGARPYSYVTFAGARIEFQQADSDIRYHDGSPVYDAATDKAAEQAQRINDLLFDVAERAARAAIAAIHPPIPDGFDARERQVSVARAIERDLRKMAIKSDAKLAADPALVRSCFRDAAMAIDRLATIATIPDASDVRECLAVALDGNGQDTFAEAIRDGDPGLFVLPAAVALRALTTAHQAGIAVGRAAAVKWLRTNPGLLIDLPSPDDGPFTQQEKTIALVRKHDADAIERGDHLKENSRG